jgi:hypothetical protein
MMDTNLTIIIVGLTVFLLGFIFYVSYKKYKEDPDRFFRIWFIATIAELFIELFRR